MYTTKESAAMAGEMFYISGKPCRRGHTSTRYVSSGNCVECVSEKAKQNKIKMIYRKRIANSKKAKDTDLYAAIFPISIHPMLDRMQAIFQGNDVILQQRILATITGAPVSWDRDAFITAGVIWNGQYITNAAQFPIGSPFAIQIGGVWWPGGPLMDVLRGTLGQIEPCDYTPYVED